MPVTVDDDTIQKFVTGVYGVKYMRSWFLLQLQMQQEKQQTTTSASEGQDQTPHEKILVMFNAMKQNEFAVTKWEKDFLTDNQEEMYLSEGPKGQIAMVEKLWRRFRT